MKKKYIRCSNCGQRYPAGVAHNARTCGGANVPRTPGKAPLAPVGENTADDVNVQGFSFSEVNIEDLPHATAEDKKSGGGRELLTMVPPANHQRSHKYSKALSKKV